MPGDRSGVRGLLESVGGVHRPRHGGVAAAGPQAGRGVPAIAPGHARGRRSVLRRGWQDGRRVTTGSGGGDCGFPFKEGLDYVVYDARRTGSAARRSARAREQRAAEAASDWRTRARWRPACR